MHPVKRIANTEDLDKFHLSKTYNEVLDFVLLLNTNAINHKNGLVSPPSKYIEQIYNALQEVAKIVQMYPPAETESRFGKPEFRDFQNHIEKHSFELLNFTNNQEVHTYFAESFGNKLRLDYGSGHELNFICFLLCLYKLDFINKDDLPNLVNFVFFKYLKVMRFVQQTYFLEPAGSHGVWGLDDYHFLPFMFGSAQLLNDPYLRPISIHDVDLVDMYKDSNMYFWQIEFINRVKTVSLRWHSPMLDDISGVKKWEKVNQGMIKMYKAEVLGKLPIVQHFLFGEILPAPDGVTKAEDIGEDLHVKCWAECCGIRVPAAVSVKGHLLRKEGVPMD